MIDNPVFIGNKPFMNYVIYTVSLLKASDEVTIKARGRFISRAVDVAEIVTKRFLEKTKVKDIRIDSEYFQNKEGKNSMVSVIEIRIANEK